MATDTKPEVEISFIIDTVFSSVCNRAGSVSVF